MHKSTHFWHKLHTQEQHKFSFSFSVSLLRGKSVFTFNKSAGNLKYKIQNFHSTFILGCKIFCHERTTMQSQFILILPNMPKINFHVHIFCCCCKLQSSLLCTFVVFEDDFTKFSHHFG